MTGVAGPVELTFLRHGESEGERARSLGGREVPADFWSRPPRTWRLTERGVSQARRAAVWLRTDGADAVGRGLEAASLAVSPALRAIETAGLLDLPDAAWRIEVALADRSWGSAVRSMRPEEREAWMAQVGRETRADPWFWAPPAGESLATIQARVRAFLNDHIGLADRCLFVTHGEVIQAVRGIFEGAEQHWTPMGEGGFRTGHLMMLVYSRRDPGSAKVGERYAWARRIDPLAGAVGDWEAVGSPLSTSALLSIAGAQPPAF